MKKRKRNVMKGKLWFCSLAFLLTGCSGVKDSVLGMDWDGMIDNMVNVAVDSLLEKDGQESTAGNVAPTPPANLAVPDQVNLRYWNDLAGDGAYNMAVFGDNVVTLGGGWEVPGFLIEASRVNEEFVADIFANPEGFSFTYEFMDYDMEQNLIVHSFDCRTAGTTSHDSIYFTYYQDGNQITRAVLNTGVVTDDQGWIVSQPVEYVTFYVPFGTQMMDMGKSYTNIQDYHTSREEEYWSKRVYGAEFVVSQNVVIAMST